MQCLLCRSSGCVPLSIKQLALSGLLYQLQKDIYLYRDHKFVFLFDNSAQNALNIV